MLTGGGVDAKGVLLVAAEEAVGDPQTRAVGVLRLRLYDHGTWRSRTHQRYCTRERTSLNNIPPTAVPIT